MLFFSEVLQCPPDLPVDRSAAQSVVRTGCYRCTMYGDTTSVLRYYNDLQKASAIDMGTGDPSMASTKLDRGLAERGP
jgi:hypothetical protein